MNGSCRKPASRAVRNPITREGTNAGGPDNGSSWKRPAQGEREGPITRPKSSWITSTLSSHTDGSKTLCAKRSVMEAAHPYHLGSGPHHRGGPARASGGRHLARSSTSTTDSPPEGRRRGSCGRWYGVSQWGPSLLLPRSSCDQTCQPPGVRTAQRDTAQPLKSPLPRHIPPTRLGCLTGP